MHFSDCFHLGSCCDRPTPLLCFCRDLEFSEWNINPGYLFMYLMDIVIHTFSSCSYFRRCLTFIHTVDVWSLPKTYLLFHKPRRLRTFILFD